MEEQLIGKVTHFFGRPGVGMVKLSDTLKIGDTIHIKGKSSDFTQQISSMQVEHASVNEAKAGDEVGVKVDQKVHEHDSGFKVTE